MATKVLLIDDEVRFVETMSKRLSKRDLAVLTAFSGAEGLDRLRRESNTDVVVLDIRMPSMDGIETLREIKREFPLVEVIMMTGHASVESAIEGMRLGAFDYLIKPCGIEELLAKIKEAKAKRARHEERIARFRIHENASQRGD